MNGIGNRLHYSFNLVEDMQGRIKSTSEGPLMAKLYLPRPHEQIFCNKFSMTISIACVMRKFA